MNIKESFLLNIETPAYVYDINLITNTLEQCINHSKILPSKIFYALKANYNKSILECVRNKSIGIECVSQGEIELALKSNFSPSNILFTGVGKTIDEIEFAIRNDVQIISIENIEEIDIIENKAKELNKNQQILVRINPDINANTHLYISTALPYSKFGISISEIDEVINKIKSSSFIDFLGLHFHIGSQITQINVFKELCSQINKIVEIFTSKGLTIKVIDVGGGLSIDYQEPETNKIPQFDEYFKIFKQNLNLNSNQTVYFELGRSLVGQGGALLSRVLYTKKRKERNILIVDTSLSHILRPSLYNAYHKIINLSKRQFNNSILYDIHGSSCESSDIIGQNVLLPETNSGDILAIQSAGAYCEVMVSDYNLKKRPYSYII